MDPRVNQRVSPNRVALILALLLGAWLAFQYLPRKGSPPPPMASVAAESKLRVVGLADNPDWEGLPDFFAVWEDQAVWRKGKTLFAFWNPGSRTYSYYFEATQHEGDIRFRAVSREEIIRQRFQQLDEEFDAAMEAAERNAESPTHPFIFLHRVAVIKPSLPSPPPAPTGHLDQRTRIPVELKPAPIVIPPGQIKTP